jgi:hypothetical protein
MPTSQRERSDSKKQNHNQNNNNKNIIDTSVFEKSTPQELKRKHKEKLKKIHGNNPIDDDGDNYYDDEIEDTVNKEMGINIKEFGNFNDDPTQGYLYGGGSIVKLINTLINPHTLNETNVLYQCNFASNLVPQLVSSEDPNTGKNTLYLYQYIQSL